MFFYMYAVIELLAMFLDSGVIQTSTSAYPVSAFISCLAYMVRIWLTPVVHRYLCWSCGGVILLLAGQWLCGIPICGRWYSALALGKRSILSPLYGVLIWNLSCCGSHVLLSSEYHFLSLLLPSKDLPDSVTQNH